MIINIEFLNLYFGVIFIIDLFEYIIFDVKYLYVLVFIGCKGVICISLRFILIILFLVE